MMRSTRVVITGLGVVAPNGTNVKDFWQTVRDGESGIKAITHFDARKLKARIAGEIRDFDITDFTDLPVKRRIARHTKFAIAATAMALRDAGISVDSLRRASSTAVIFGVSTVAHDLFNPNVKQVARKGATAASPRLIFDAIPGAVPGAVAAVFGLSPLCQALADGCTSGLQAIATGAALVRNGDVDSAIVGGTDAPIFEIPFGSFSNADLASTANANPETASRPFDFCRDSGVISEGAGALVLESYERATARRARIYGEVRGYSAAVDSDPNRPCDGMETAIRQAMANANVSTKQISYICAHGPGHPVMDRIETEIIKRVFGNDAYRVPVSSIKGVTGNPLSASGPFQVAAAVLALAHSIVPPTANCDAVDPLCDLDYVTEGARHVALETALINTHGIRGNNVCMVVGKHLH